jgi:predicted DNA-binding transcriptional regulator AlpA
MPDTGTEFFTKRELARLCRCSERTLDRLLEIGDAPPVTRLSTRRIIFPAAAARSWLAQRTTETKGAQIRGADAA